MKKRYLGLSLALSLLGGVSMAQQKISDGSNTEGIAIHADAILELSSANKGLLHTRVALERSTSAFPLSKHVAGMMVYNTMKVNDVVPGIYYNDGAKWVLASAGSATNIFYNPTDYIITYIDAEGKEVNIDFKKVVKDNETVTTLVKNQNGTYTYTSENGTVTVIDVPADVINNFEQIVNNGDVLNHLIEVLGDTFVGGNVYYDGNKFTYITQEGERKEITLTELVKANETRTQLVKNANGTYTYYNEVEIDASGNPVAGTGTVIDIPASVIQNFQDIISNEAVKNELFETIHNTYVGGNVYYDGDKFTYITETGETKEITIKELVEANETKTIVRNNNNGTYTYFNEEAIDANGQPIEERGVVIDVPASVVNQFNEIVNSGPVTINGDTYNTIEEYLQHVVEANETVTNIADNQDGTYTYTNEKGETFIIDVPASVVNQFENIYNDIVNETITVNGDNYNTFEEYLTQIANQSVKIGGSEFVNVTGTGTEADPYQVSIKEGLANTMLITNVDGELQWATIKDIVSANETVTTLEKTANGTYTYTSEDNTVTVIDIPASVVENFETIVNEGPVTVNGDTFTTIEEYIEHIANSSVTINGGDNITVTGSGTTADPYVVTIEGGADNSMLITDENGDVVWATIEDIVKGNETVTTLTASANGTYTYTSEDNTVTVIDIPAS
ncbi:hypothetical protein, partial [Sphingobacterium wenxiniae]